MIYRLLDLFCGAGGAGMGYHRAGFEVVGVDIAPQPRYPFEFHQSDALEYLAGLIMSGDIYYYDAVHLSPPCQANTQLASIWRAVEGYDYDVRHIDLIAQSRELVQAADRPYVLENVVGAALVNPIMLCGTFFGLRVYRHRLFETSWFMLAPSHVPHRDKTPHVGRGKSPKGFVSVTGTGGFGFKNGFQYAQKAMGIDWMTRTELSQAIPPAYTEYIGRQLMAIMTRR